MLRRNWVAVSLAAAASFGCDTTAPSDPQAIAEVGPGTPSPAIVLNSKGKKCPKALPSWLGRWVCSLVGANDEERIVRIRAGAPPLETTSVSFYAVRGRTREARIFFTNGTGGRGSEYLRITIRPRSLLKRPNGQPIAVGDSILITMKVVDPRLMLWQLLPEGLTFNSNDPAYLVAHYIEADKDFDGDGDQDFTDQMIESRLAIWRQPLGQPFAQLTSLLDLDLDRVSADVPGFSRFAIAY